MNRLDFFCSPKPQMSIRVYRPLSIETGPPYRPLYFEIGAEYYHAESTTRDIYLEFWANPNDLKFVGAFIEEVSAHELDGSIFRGAIFRLPTVDHLVRYNPSGTSCFMRGPMRARVQN